MVSKHLQLGATMCGLLMVAGSAGATGKARPMDRTTSSPAATYDNATTSWYVDAELIVLLEKEVSRKVSAYLQQNGVLRIVDAKVSVDMERRMVMADFGPGFRPGPDEADMLMHDLAITLRYYVEKAGLPSVDVDFLFQGKPLKHYYPKELAVPPQARNDPDNQTVLVSASHGLIRVHPSLDWAYQRPEAFGFREDLITPAYADELQAVLEARSGVAVTRARNRIDEDHPESNHPWGHMSARYHLKSLLPDRSAIWNSLPNSTDNDREVKEDIRARPLYANHLGVGGMLSLHTNGSDKGDARGAEVYYHADKPGDRELAASVLCGMRELIHAQPGYESFPLKQEPNSGRHGENRIGTMPSIIVEIAYHSNAEDSAALQDPVFRAASMKGVEKGYRLFREGKVCAPFVLQPIADVALPAGTSRKITLPFNGNPQFPVTMEFTTASCSRPGACTPSKTTFTDPAVPVTVDMRCRGSLTGEARWSVVLRDTDGVVTAPVEFQQTCFKPASPPAA